MALVAVSAPFPASSWGAAGGTGFLTEAHRAFPLPLQCGRAMELLGQGRNRNRVLKRCPYPKGEKSFACCRRETGVSLCAAPAAGQRPSLKTRGVVLPVPSSVQHRTCLRGASKGMQHAALPPTRAQGTPGHRSRPEPRHPPSLSLRSSCVSGPCNSIFLRLFKIKAFSQQAPASSVPGSAGAALP